MKHAHWMLLAALSATQAVAQEVRNPDPVDPKAKAPAPVYRSAFEGYRAQGEAKRIPWREANDEVERVGGHIGILREQARQGERK
ncbi:MAG: hypothetical protein AB7K53_11795 [Burkholderiales bacterium]